MKIKGLILFYFLVIFCESSAQIKYITWGFDGKYLFSSKDSFDLIKKIKSDTTNKHISFNGIFSFEYYTILVSNNNHTLLIGAKLIILDLSLKNIIVSDSLFFVTPEYDSFPDGKWFKYVKQGTSILIKEFKEVESKMKKKYHLYFDSLYVNEINYEKGFPIGLETIMYKNKITTYECKYKNLFRFKEYEKLFDKTGKIIYIKNYNTYLYTKYYVNGKKHKTSKIDKYGNLYGKTKFWY